MVWFGLDAVFFATLLFFPKWREGNVALWWLSALDGCVGVVLSHSEKKMVGTKEGGGTVGARRE